MQVSDEIKNNKWLLILAYLSVILIWSTTPLTVKWSGEGVSYLFGIVLRMLIGATLASLLTLIFYKRIPMNKNAYIAYSAVAIMLFGGMMPVYWGAQYISSGLISVIFGVTPIVTGYFAWRFLHEQSFSIFKITGALAGMTGLSVIFLQYTSVNGKYIYGIIAVSLAVMVHSISSVWIKSMHTKIQPLALVAGGLLFSLPLFITVYLIFAPALPEVIPLKAIWSIIYLGVIGSVVGFVSFYYLLQYLPASSVALITIVTPVVALWMGNMLNNEAISVSILIGTAFVLTGLALHQWGDVMLKKYAKN